MTYRKTVLSSAVATRNRNSSGTSLALDCLRETAWETDQVHVTTAESPGVAITAWRNWLSHSCVAVRTSRFMSASPEAMGVSRSQLTRPFGSVPPKSAVPHIEIVCSVGGSVSYEIQPVGNMTSQIGFEASTDAADPVVARTSIRAAALSTSYVLIEPQPRLSWIW